MMQATETCGDVGRVCRFILHHPVGRYVCILLCSDQSCCLKVNVLAQSVIIVSVNASGSSYTALAGHNRPANRSPGRTLKANL